MNHRFTRFLIFAFLVLPIFGLSQGEWNNWYFGNKAGVTFNPGFPVALLNSNIFTNRTSVSISDSGGNFLFYSNEGNIYDKNLNLMPNGSGLYCGGGPGDQPVFSVKFISDDSTYYTFIVDLIQYPYVWETCGLRYSILNMRLNNNLGDIEPGFKNIPVPGAFPATSCITATRHQNNKDVWLAVRLFTTKNHFAVYKITSSGIDTIPVISNSLGNTDSTQNSDWVSWLKFSPDGNRFVCLYTHFGEFCQFNKQTGIITPLFKFCPTLGSGSVLCMSAEFSDNGKFIYVTKEAGANSYIYQFDATKTDSSQFMQSEVLLGEKVV